jgi:hypothetical protein
VILFLILQFAVFGFITALFLPGWVLLHLVALWVIGLAATALTDVSPDTRRTLH